MSFVTTIKDYIDLLNNLYDSHIELSVFLYQSCVFVLLSFKNLFLYLVTFQWFRDFCYLPVLVPQISDLVNKETLFLDQDSTTLFQFVESTTLKSTTSKFLIGFFNSFFLSLPLSCGHLIALQRLIIRGPYAGLAAALGTGVGHWLLLISILFGLRGFIIPWFSLGTAYYLVSLILIVSYLYNIRRNLHRRIVSLSQTGLLGRFFFFNLVLAWCEQSSIYQYLPNLALNSEPSSLELLSSPLITQKLYYLSGILIGTLFFTLVFGFCFLKIQDFLVVNVFGLVSRFKSKFDTLMVVCIIALAFTSLTYYSFDYLIGAPLGFVSQDKGLEITPFVPSTASKNKKNSSTTNSLTGQNISSVLSIDKNTFDRGLYLEKDNNQFQDNRPPWSFEDLNLTNNRLWHSRLDENKHGLLRKYNTLSGVDLYSWLKAKFPTIQPVPSQKVKELSNNQNLIVNQFGKQNKVKPNSLDKGSLTKKRSQSQQQANSTNKENWNQNENLENLDQRFNNEISIPPYSKVSKDQSFNFFSRIEENSDPIKGFINENFLTLITNSFSNDYYQDLVSPEIASKRAQFTNQYFSNPICKFLLAADIDNFASRQPKSRFLASNQEKALFQKRQILSAYYDTLRAYNKLPFIDEFNLSFSGSKSYADRVYNQQFKGTLQLVRRLFSISIDSKQQESKLVAKFDQPLFLDLENKPPNLHEELINHFSPNSRFSPITSDNKSSEKERPLPHTISGPFLEAAYPIPFYAGWDQNLRQLVVTNRLQPRSLAGYKIPIQETFADNSLFLDSKPVFSEKSKQKKSIGLTKEGSNYDRQDIKNKEIKNLVFTAWPINKKVFNSLTPNPPYTVLFKSVDDPKNADMKSTFVDLDFFRDQEMAEDPNLEKNINSENSEGKIEILGRTIKPAFVEQEDLTELQTSTNAASTADTGSLPGMGSDNQQKSSTTRNTKENLKNFSELDDQSLPKAYLYKTLPVNIVNKGEEDPQSQNQKQNKGGLGDTLNTSSTDGDVELYGLVPPSRGGFVWPGHPILKFDVKSLFLKR